VRYAEIQGEKSLFGNMTTVLLYPSCGEDTGTFWAPGYHPSPRYRLEDPKWQDRRIIPVKEVVMKKTSLRLVILCLVVALAALLLSQGGICLHEFPG